jgi:hypothetical protein
MYLKKKVHVCTCTLSEEDADTRRLGNLRWVFFFWNPPKRMYDGKKFGRWLTARPPPDKRSQRDSERERETRVRVRVLRNAIHQTHTSFRIKQIIYNYVRADVYRESVRARESARKRESARARDNEREREQEQEITREKIDETLVQQQGTSQWVLRNTPQSLLRAKLFRFKERVCCLLVLNSVTSNTY